MSNKILISILVILAIGFGSFIVYDKFFSHKEINQEKSVINSNNPDDQVVTVPVSTNETKKPEEIKNNQNEITSTGQFGKIYKNTKVGYQFNYRSDFHVGVFIDSDMYTDLPEDLRAELKSNPNYSDSYKAGIVVISSKPLPNLQDAAAVAKSGFDDSQLTAGISINKNNPSYKKDVPADAKKISSYLLRGYSCEEYETLDQSQISIQGYCRSGNNDYSYFYLKKDGAPFDPWSIILY